MSFNIVSETPIPTFPATSVKVIVNVNVSSSKLDTSMFEIGKTPAVTVPVTAVVVVTPSFIVKEYVSPIFPPAKTTLNTSSFAILA